MSSVGILCLNSRKLFYSTWTKCATQLAAAPPTGSCMRFHVSRSRCFRTSLLNSITRRPLVRVVDYLLLMGELEQEDVCRLLRLLDPHINTSHGPGTHTLVAHASPAGGNICRAHNYQTPGAHASQAPPHNGILEMHLDHAIKLRVLERSFLVRVFNCI